MKRKICAFAASAAVCFLFGFVLRLMITPLIWRLLFLACITFILSNIAAWIWDDRIGETFYGKAITLGAVLGTLLSLYF